MKCPHCTIHFHDNWNVHYLERGSGIPQTRDAYWYYRSALCPNCKDVTLEVALMRDKELVGEWRRIYPVGASRGPVPPEVPKEIAEDYIEACNVLPISAKASAALARRCLQNILHGHGYKAKDLANEIDLLLNEADPKKSSPTQIA